MSNNNKIFLGKKRTDKGIKISRNNINDTEEDILKFQEENEADKISFSDNESSPELPQITTKKHHDEDNSSISAVIESKPKKKTSKSKDDKPLLERDVIEFPTLIECYGNENGQKTKDEPDIHFKKNGKSSLEVNTHFYPWISNFSPTNKFRGVLKLHYEILDFYEFIKPSQEEIENREKVYHYIENIIKKHWPDWKVEKYGSFTTGLSLPDSDIDLVIHPDTKPTDVEKLLKKISDIFLSEKTFSYIEVIKARVPIIKGTFKENGINIDISIMRSNFYENKKIMDNILKEYPYIRPLIFVIKYFLRQKKLNDLHTGGISSFLLFNLVLSYILYIQKERAESHSSKLLTLGHLLIGFFQFYGFDFNYEDIGMSVRYGGFFYKRSNKEFGSSNAKGKNLLSFENFQDLNQDLGKNCFKYIKVIDSFKLARDALYYPCYYPIQSYLGLFITVDDLIRERYEKKSKQTESEIICID